MSEKMVHIGWVVQTRHQFMGGTYSRWQNLSTTMNRLKFQAIRTALSLGCDYYKNRNQHLVRLVKVYTETPDDT